MSPYLPRMMGVIGPFVLSQDITPSYDHDISVMRLVVRREDLPRVKDIVSRHAAEVVGELFQGGGPADIVQTLTRKVPVRLADEYYGFSAPHDEQMMAWARSCFREFFINLLDNPEIRAPAVAAGAEMRERLDALLAERARCARVSTRFWLGYARCASVSTRFWRSAAPRTLRAGTMSWAAYCVCSVRAMSQASTMTAYAEP